MRIGARTLLTGIVGMPVAQSRSPLLHNHWLARHGIDGAYVPLPVLPEHLGAAIRGLRAAGFRGVNVTVPHKEAALALCNTADGAAWRAGAVNTLVFDADGVHGRNTDGRGFIDNLRANGVDPAAGPALVLGAGGAARAVITALQDSGARVICANRTRERAAALAAVLPGLEIVTWPEIGAALGGATLLVNTASLGGPGAQMPAIDLADARPDLAVADIVYAPLETPLLALARLRGLRTVTGLGMLIRQAIPGFAAWWGVSPAADAEVLDLLTADLAA